jgi:hypothetical protein
MPAGAARVAGEAGGVVDGVGEDDDVIEPCDGGDFPNASWGGGDREVGGGPAEPIMQVDQLGHPGRGPQPHVVPEQAGSARSSAAAS